MENLTIHPVLVVRMLGMKNVYFIFLAGNCYLGIVGVVIKMSMKLILSGDFRKCMGWGRVPLVGKWLVARLHFCTI